VPFEVGPLVHPPVSESGSRHLRVIEGGRDLLWGPHEELALDSFGVGVLGGEEAARGMRHLAEDIVERLFAHAPVLGVVRGEPAVQVERGELGIIIEHLLEVRHQPLPVHRIAMEAAADLIVHAAAGHLGQGEVGHVLRLHDARALPVAQEEFPVHGLGKLGRAPRASLPRVELARQSLVGRAPEPLALAHLLEELLARLHHVAPPRPVGLGHSLEQTGKGGHAVAILGGKVGAAVEGHAVRSEEDGHRPAAVPGHGLDGLHVDLVHVGALFAVHLDVHEELVHEGGGVLVLEGLALHDVAPVAGGIADGQQHGLVLGACALKGFRTPRIPVDRIVPVLEKIRARLLREAVGVPGLGHDRWDKLRRASRRASRTRGPRPGARLT